MSVDEKMTAIADAIRRYTGRSDKLSLGGMATGVSEVFGVGNTDGYNNGYNEGREEGLSEGRTQGYGLGFEEGKQAEYDAFWDAFQNNGRETGRIYSNAFSYDRFNDETYNPKYNIICQTGITAADMLFYRSGLTSTKVPIYILGSRMSQSFGKNPQLVSIPYLHVNESATFASLPFHECSALETLIMGGTIGQNGFDVQWSPKLNKVSIESIINALSAKESGLTVTLSETAVNNAFTAEEWDALEATKTNWTISLV